MAHTAIVQVPRTIPGLHRTIQLLKFRTILVEEKAEVQALQVIIEDRSSVYETNFDEPFQRRPGPSIRASKSAIQGIMYRMGSCRFPSSRTS